jgi:hypothetical protein
MILTVVKSIIEYFNKIGIPESEGKSFHGHSTSAGIVLLTQLKWISVAAVLRERYYIEYGLSIRGMIQHHQVDPVDFGKRENQRMFSSLYLSRLVGC